MITSQGSGSAVFEGSGDQAVPFLRDQGPKLVTLFMIEDQKFQGTNMGSAMKTYFVMTLEKASFYFISFCQMIIAVSLFLTG